MTVKQKLLVEQVVKLVTLQLLQEKKKKKEKDWVSKIDIKKGALSKDLGIPETENIPVSLLKKKKVELQKKAEGEKKLSKSDLRLLRRINFALNLKKMKK
jgi:hypothetical protein